MKNCTIYENSIENFIYFKINSLTAKTGINKYEIKIEDVLFEKLYMSSQENINSTFSLTMGHLLFVDFSSISQKLDQKYINELNLQNFTIANFSINNIANKNILNGYLIYMFNIVNFVAKNLNFYNIIFFSGIMTSKTHQIAISNLNFKNNNQTEYFQNILFLSDFVKVDISNISIKNIKTHLYLLGFNIISSNIIDDLGYSNIYTKISISLDNFIGEKNFFEVISNSFCGSIVIETKSILNFFLNNSNFTSNQISKKLSIFGIDATIAVINSLLTTSHFDNIIIKNNSLPSFYLEVNEIELFKIQVVSIQGVINDKNNMIGKIIGGLGYFKIQKFIGKDIICMDVNLNSISCLSFNLYGNSSFSLQNSDFINCISTKFSPGIYLTLQNTVVFNGVIENCKFVNLTLENSLGSAIFVENYDKLIMHLSLKNLLFNNVISNKINELGGALYFYSITADFENIYLDNNNLASNANLFYFYLSQINFNNLTAKNFEVSSTNGAFINSVSSKINIEKLLIKNGIFSQNGIILNGLGFYLKSSDLKINNGLFENLECKTCKGGGIFSIESQITINNTNFIKIKCEQGAGIFLIETHIQIELSRILIQKRMLLEARNNVIDNAIFYKNKAEIGGAIYIENANTKIINTKFTENHATSTGIIFSNIEASLSYVVFLENLNFTNNSANYGTCVSFKKKFPYIPNLNSLKFVNNTAEVQGIIFYSGNPSKLMLEYTNPITKKNDTFINSHTLPFG